MAGLLRPYGRLASPGRMPLSGDVSIDWNHPLTNALSAAYVPGITLGQDLSLNSLNLTAAGVPSRLVAEEGPGFYTTTASNVGWKHSGCPAALRGNQGSAYVRGVLVGTIPTGDAHLVGPIHDQGGGVWCSSPGIWYAGATGKLTAAALSGTTEVDVTAASALTSTSKFSAGTTYLVGGNVILYLDGKNAGSAAMSTTPSSTGTWNIDLGYSDIGTGVMNNTVIYVGYIWNRALSAAEMLQLHLDPYCFLISDEAEMPAVFVQGFIPAPGLPCEPLVLPQPNLLALQQESIFSNPSPTPDRLGGWYAEPPDLQKHPAHLDTNQGRQATYFNWSASQLALSYWSQPPDLLRHLAAPDTNQWTLPFAGLNAFSPPGVFWWNQPPDLLKHWAPLDTNESRLVSQQFAEPGVFWWDQPPDLLKHPTLLDTNESRLVSQQFATPASLAFWFVPPDLQKHPPELWTPQRYLPPLPSFPNLTPVIFWWAQPPDLLRRPPHLDTNEPRLVSQQFATPSAFWWNQPPDTLRHPAHLDTNQGFDAAFSIWSLQAPPTPRPLGWWLQQLDLQRHPPELWAPQQHLPPLPSFPGLTPPAIVFWSQPPDLLRHAPHLDTNESRLVAQQFAEPGTWWWIEPPDLQRHAAHLDTNQPRVSYQDRATPIAFGFFRQPMDGPRRAPELAPAAPYIGPMPSGATATGFGFWIQPQFQQPRAPDLWAGQTYASQGAAYATAPLILQPAPLIMRAQLPLSIMLGGVAIPAALTPKSLAFYFHSDLQRHPPERFTWQDRLGTPPNLAAPTIATYFGQPQDLLRVPPREAVQSWLYIPGYRFPFLGSAFVAMRAKIRAIQARARHNIAAAARRARVVAGTRSRQRLPDLSPPIVAGTEQEFVIFDFGQILSPGDSIQAVTINCSTDYGPDVAPGSRILGPATIIPAPSTGAASGAAGALFGDMIAGNLYLLQCVANTLNGQELVLEVRWSCVAVM